MASLPEAACLGMDVSLFYPEEDSPTLAADTEAAKAVCASCPVKGECLLLGMDEDWGVWGGTTPAERKALLASERKA